MPTSPSILCSVHLVSVCEGDYLVEAFTTLGGLLSTECALVRRKYCSYLTNT